MSAVLKPSATRLDQAFAALKEKGRKALIPYITCGDPFPEKTVELMLAMAEAGADTDRAARLGVHNSIGFNKFCDFPREQQIADLRCARLALGDNL